MRVAKLTKPRRQAGLTLFLSLCDAVRRLVVVHVVVAKGAALLPAGGDVPCPSGTNATLCAGSCFFFCCDSVRLGGGGGGVYSQYISAVCQPAGTKWGLYCAGFDPIVARDKGTGRYVTIPTSRLIQGWWRVPRSRLAPCTCDPHRGCVVSVACPIANEVKEVPTLDFILTLFFHDQIRRLICQLPEGELFLFV